MKDLGMMHYFLGLKVWQRIDEIFLSQVKYTVEILKKLEARGYTNGDKSEETKCVFF